MATAIAAPKLIPVEAVVDFFIDISSPGFIINNYLTVSLQYLILALKEIQIN